MLRTICLSLCCWLPVGTLLATPAQCPVTIRTYPLYDREGKTLTCYDQWQQDFFRELQCPLQLLDGNPSPIQREQKLQQGQIEVITGLAKTAQRPFQFSDAIASNHIYLYRLLDQPFWDQIKDWCDPVMQQARIIVPAEGYFGEGVERLRKEPRCAGWVQLTPRGAGRHFNMLDKGRADLLINSELYWRLLPADQASRYKKLPLVVVTGEIYLAFSQQVPTTFIDKVNQLIARRRQQQIPVCELLQATALPTAPPHS